MNEEEIEGGSEVDPDYEDYSKALRGEPIMALLRVHLLTEYYLERIIHLQLARGDKLIESGNFSYSQKLSLVSAMNVLPDDLLSCLKNLNKVRNKCSHEKDYQPTFADVELIGRPLGKNYTKLRRERPHTVENMLGYVVGHICAGITAIISYQEELLTIDSTENKTDFD
ncbi:MAG: hypothetical protein QOG71_2704 [Pyrinomonadaceae bacterium]|nr:hypothetical protein [Pyrinomonadaceae bacterium]